MSEDQAFMAPANFLKPRIEQASAAKIIAAIAPRGLHP